MYTYAMADISHLTIIEHHHHHHHGFPLAQAVVSLVGAGYYTANSYGDTANLELGADNDTITCSVQWATDAYTTSVFITVRDGPIFDTDNPAFTGDRSSPVWVHRQVNLFDSSTAATEAPLQRRQNLSLRADLGLTTNRTMRVVGCTVVGADRATGLPVRFAATSKLFINGTERSNSSTTPKQRQALLREMGAQNATTWIDFGYPIYTEPCLAQGCITTVLIAIRQPTFLAVGRAINWPGRESRNDTVFVAAANPTGSSDGSLWQIGPSIDMGANLTDATDGPRSAAVLAQVQPVTGLDVDGQGALYVAGAVAGTGAIAYAPWQAAATTYAAINGSTYLGPAGTLRCLTATDGRLSNRLRYLSLDGAWRHPATGDVFVADGGCGFLYRIERAAFNASCSPFGSCGRALFMANLTAAANLTVRADGSKYQNISLAGDVQRGLLYAAYGQQCGVMALNLTTGSTVGWVTSSAFPLGNQTVELPLCGYAGDGGPATGAAAAMSADIRQLAVDGATGDLYIADTGNAAIRKVDFASRNISTVAGTGQGGYTGDNGPAALATLWEPSGVAVVDVPDAAVPGRSFKYLYIADTSNDAVRRVLLNDPFVVMAARTQRPTQRPTTQPSTAPTRSPTRPTRSPSRSPSRSPTIRPWATGSDCRDCVASTIFDNIQKVVCTCGRASPSTFPEDGITCYSSCCPSQTVTYDYNGGFDCSGSPYCTAPGQGSDALACPAGWNGNFTTAGCTNCFSEEVPGQPGVVKLQCACSSGGGGASATRACYSNCCPFRVVDAVNGTMRCRFSGSCSNANGGACTPTQRPTVQPTAPTLRPSVSPTGSPTARPSMRPTVMPTAAPSQAPTNFPWSLSPSIAAGCHNCSTSTAFNGDSQLTCICNGQRTTCFSSCCPSGAITQKFFGSKVLYCGGTSCSVAFPDPVWSNVTEFEQFPCPKAWAAPPSCICHEPAPVWDVRRISCQCPVVGSSPERYTTSSCYESCCPAKGLVVSANGTVVCATGGGTCTATDGLPC